MTMPKSWLAALLAIGALLAAGCSSSPAPSAPTPGQDENAGMPGPEGGDAGGSQDVIRIKATDALRFEPASIAVPAGEPVRLEVTNVGAMPHEFIVGDEEAQMAHENQMGQDGSMQHMDMDLPALRLEPGETKDAVATFDEPGKILYACHVLGHYAAGMVGTITVT